MKASALLTEIKNTKLKMSLMSINSKTKNKNRNYGNRKAKNKDYKSKIYSMVAENSQSKNPHFEGIIFYFLFLSVIIVHSPFNFILIQKKSESKIK